MARRAWTCIAAAALTLLLRVDSASSSTETSVTAGLEAELLQLQDDDVDAVQQLAQQALDPLSSSELATRALVELGDLFFYGNATLGTRVNGTRALQFYTRAAAEGDARAQFHVGVAQSYGFWGVTRDEPAALVRYYFAALGGDTAATLALGHRHLLGVATPKNCETAVRYYEAAANKAVALREAATSQPAIVDATPRRLKTVAESQHKKNVPSDAAIVDYYEFSADKGDPDATLHLATLYYYGARGLEQDLVRAASLFHKAYALGAAAGAYHLGHIYSRGLGVAANNETALQYLQEAAAAGNTQAMNELASMHLLGRGTVRDVQQATSLFQTAAKQGSMDAFYNLGVLHMQPRDSLDASSTGRRDPEYEVAHGYFQVAAHQGHTIASHKLGHMSLHGIGTTRSCKSAVESFKLVAERGPWDRVLARAFADFNRQDYAAAFAKYAVMAQQGYEVAQHNAAYLLDHGYLSSVLEFAGAEAAAVEAAAPADAREAAALALYKLAALQGNVDANLKIGDFYYYGRGGCAVDASRASAHYSLASKRANAQALFNLAFMYEHGVGVLQDLPLAKRFLDKARDAHGDAHVPVALALWKLQAHSLLLNWRRRWDIWVGNVAAPEPVPVAEPVSPAATADSAVATERSPIESLLATWWPSIVSSSSADASSHSSNGASESMLHYWRDAVHDVLASDDFLIVLLLFALGVVLYIRSERQHMLGDPMPQPEQQAQPQVQAQ